ncbi:MAG: hypothetical protein ORN58_07635, partial [Sediminibacterium sp.]|nr:hypothetical protein [Sediminibacterium sp.]
ILDQILSLETENEVIEFKEKKGIPITFKGHYYGRFGESTTPLGIEKIERIRKQSAYIDWSIKTIADATINDLDELAILKAKVNYQSKNPRLFEEIKNWDNKTFLQKTQLIIDNKITNTAILLLGKSSAAHFISPAIAHITWILKDKNNTEKDYQHFSCPFIITIDEILAKIRILKYRFFKKNSLFTEEVDTYNVQDIREAISNCIAHQDYTLASRINIVEFEDNKLMFINAGQFLPGDINNVLFTEDPPLVYRNNFLVQTMFKFNMIDTIGSGIKRIFYNQLKKYFPMPDYDISNNIVKMTIAGKIMNENYTEILMNNPDLKIEEIIILDKVQKKLPILDSEA